MKGLKESVRRMAKEALSSILEEDDFWNEIDAALQEELDKSSCRITFHDGKDELFLQLGSGEAMRICSPVPIWTFGDFDIADEVRGIDNFIKRLEKAKADLLANGSGHADGR